MNFSVDFPRGQAAAFRSRLVSSRGEVLSRSEWIIWCYREGTEKKEESD